MRIRLRMIPSDVELAEPRLGYTTWRERVWLCSMSQVGVNVNAHDIF